MTVVAPTNKYKLKEIAFNECPDTPEIRIPWTNHRKGTDNTLVNVGGIAYVFQKVDKTDCSYGTRWDIYRRCPRSGIDYPPVFGMIKFSSAESAPLFVQNRNKPGAKRRFVVVESQSHADLFQPKPVKKKKQQDTAELRTNWKVPQQERSSRSLGYLPRHIFGEADNLPYQKILVALPDAGDAGILTVQRNGVSRIQRHLQIGSLIFSFKGLCKTEAQEGVQAYFAEYQTAELAQKPRPHKLRHPLFFWVTKNLQPMEYDPAQPQGKDFDEFVHNLKIDDPLLKDHTAIVSLTNSQAQALEELFRFLNAAQREIGTVDKRDFEDLSKRLFEGLGLKASLPKGYSLALLAHLLMGLAADGSEVSELKLNGCTVQAGKICSALPHVEDIKVRTSFGPWIFNNHAILHRPKGQSVQVDYFVAKDAKRHQNRPNPPSCEEKVLQPPEKLKPMAISPLAPAKRENLFPADVFDLNTFQNTHQAGWMKQRLVYSIGHDYQPTLIFVPQGGSQEFHRGRFRHR